MLRQSGTWALVDHLVGNAVAPLLDAQRDLLPVLGRWAVDDDLWIRRAAILSLLPFLKRGEQWPRFERLAEPMLDDPGFFIRKVLGWVLRDAARKHPDRTADWLRPRVHRVSGLTFREATRKLPRELRAELEALRG
jgi:3-methyladenine DNA glycosylase AlkD